MVEGAQIDWGGHERDATYMIEELLDFDRAVGEALDFAVQDGNTLVIVASDHETGGYSITDNWAKEKLYQGEFTSFHHTGTMVPVFAYGPGAEMFGGIYDNTEIFDKMMKAYGFE